VTVASKDTGWCWLAWELVRAVTAFRVVSEVGSAAPAREAVTIDNARIPISDFIELALEKGRHSLIHPRRFSIGHQGCSIEPGFGETEIQVVRSTGWRQGCGHLMAER
jgi:hypothetical protein